MLRPAVAATIFPSLEHLPRDFRAVLSRATHPHHVIELLVVADYSAYKNWYDRTSSSDTPSHRSQQAVNNLKDYIASLIRSSNIVYDSLQHNSIYVQIKLVDVLVTKDQAHSSWTENQRVHASPKDEVDPTKVLPSFQTYSASLQSSIPHDHAMLFTMYALFQGSGSTFSGYAYTDAVCKEKGVSIVEDNQDFYTAQLMAHEIGHSLGCKHDGDGNHCPVGQGYAMEAHFILANKNKWTFSQCSVSYIWAYLQTMIRDHSNCFDHTDSNHTPLTGKWFGQLLSADEQCQLKFGDSSYLCRDGYYDDYSLICLKLKCYDPKLNGCYYIDGGDGTSCGNKKWCMSDVCVADNQAPDVPDDCPVGEQPGVVKNGLTCKQLVQNDARACNDHKTKQKCCVTCNLHNVTHAVQTAAGNIDNQCVNKHGDGSRLCRDSDERKNGETRRRDDIGLIWI